MGLSASTLLLMLFSESLGANLWVDQVRTFLKIRHTSDALLSSSGNQPSYTVL